MESQTLSSITASHGSKSATGVSIVKFLNINWSGSRFNTQSLWLLTSTILILHYPITVVMNGISNVERLQPSTETSLDGKAVFFSTMSHTTTLSIMWVIFCSSRKETPFKDPLALFLFIYLALLGKSSSPRCLSVSFFFFYNLYYSSPPCVFSLIFRCGSWCKCAFCVLTIPADHGHQATQYLKAFIGDHYAYSDENEFKALWNNYNKCQFVENDGNYFLYIQVELGERM